MESVYEKYDLSVYGFLPEKELSSLPSYFETWEDLIKKLPELNKTKKTREAVDKLPLLESSKLKTLREIKRAYSILSLIANSYVWCLGMKNASKKIPAVIAKPLWYVSEHLGIAPILTHASVDLFNWKLKDSSKGMGLDNLESIYTVTGMKDEEWFYLIMVAIEAVGGKTVKSILNLMNANETELKPELTNIAKQINEYTNIIIRIKEKCDGDKFYNELRPYLSGWNSGSEYIKSMIYEGVDDIPKEYSGGSAAQSTLLQTLDMVFNIQHKSKYLVDIRQYMPKAHRNFIEYVSQLNLEEKVKNTGKKELIDLYETCVKRLGIFRQAHFAIVQKYIVKYIDKNDYLSVKGTGGTDLNKFLQEIIKDTTEKI